MSGGDFVRLGRATIIHDAIVRPGFDPACFDSDRWHSDPGRMPTMTERGSVLMLDAGSEIWVRRHYHRGGFAARLFYDHYLWSGLQRARPVREWRLLRHMQTLDLPVPIPVAGRVVRSGLLYQADLITVLLAGTRPLVRRGG